MLLQGDTMGQQALTIPDVKVEANTDYRLQIKEEPKSNVKVGTRLCKMVACTKSVVARWLLDITLTFPVVIGLTLTGLNIIPPRFTGFFCDDPALSYKFEGDTISITTILSVCILGPEIFLFVIEYCNAVVESTTEESKMKIAFRRSLRWYRDHLIGILYSIALLDIIKTVMSELRPHFFDSCRPNTTDGEACIPGVYVSDYVCTGTQSKWRIADARKSFPSGHATLSVYVMVFLGIYFQKRAITKYSSLLRMWLQLLICTWAVVCSCTRITDHRHHWWDVLLGSIGGAAAAIYVTRYLCNNFNSTLIIRNQINSVGEKNHTSQRQLLTSTTSSYSSTQRDGHEMIDVVT